MTKWCAVFATMFLSFVLAPTARACGGFFSSVHSSDVVAMSDIRVLLIHKYGHTDQMVQVSYSGKAQSFAWVYPVAGNPEVSEVKESPFESLDELTRPEITITTKGDGNGGGCLCLPGDAANLGPSQVVDPQVKIWKSGQVGSFDYVVISAVTANDMLDWLNTNGFAVPATTRTVLDHYVSLKWFFVAMKVSVAAAEGDVPSTTVVRFSYNDTPELWYPLRMISLAPAPETSLEIYIISSDGMKPLDPFTERYVDTSKLMATSEVSHNYDQIFAETLTNGNGRLLIQESEQRNWSPAEVKLAGIVAEGKGMVLTRYRTVLKPDDMVQDIGFASRIFIKHDSKITLHYDPDQKSEIPLFLVIGALLLAGHFSLRRRHKQASPSDSN